MNEGDAAPAHLDYEVLRLIGRGGYGEVWLVRDQAGQHLACKVIYRESFSSDRPYEREYQGIKNFEPVSRASESQVKVLHVGRRDADGYFYYIMELADDVSSGQQIDPDHYIPKTLYNELKRRGRLAAGECLRIGLSLSAALENLHEHGLVHRDIKPANIIFVNGIPKLADIGLVSTRDVTVSYVGTAGYIPPEGPGSPPADVYGLGKVLYEMSTGKDRLDFPALPEDLGNEREQAALFELNPLLLKACEADARLRYRTAAELHSDLTLLSSGKSLRDRNRTRQRQRTTAVAGVVAAAFLVLVCAGWFYFGNSPTEAVAPARPQTTIVDSAVVAPPSADLARACIRAGFDALATNDYARATEMVRAAFSAAQVAGFPRGLTEAEFLKSETDRDAAAYNKITNAFRILTSSPDDQAANLAVGKFLCVMKNDWTTGLWMLSRGNDSALRAVAQKEIKGGGAMTLGDAWWAASESASGWERTALQIRARNWYLKAIAGTNALARSALKSRLEDRLKAPLVFAEVHIASRVGNAQHIDLFPDEVRWKSQGVSTSDRINQALIGDIRGGGSKTVRNCGATRLFPEWVDFSTAKLKVDKKPRRHGKVTLEKFEDHVRINFADHPASPAEIEATVTFGTPP